MVTAMISNELPAAIQAGEVAGLVRSAGLKILDVRSSAEFEAVHIPGSYNVPLDRLPEHRHELRSLERPMVQVCRSGARARQAELLLREVGLWQLSVLDGGLQAWERAGLELVRGRQRWSLERQVRAVAGSLVLLGTLGGVLVWPPLIFLVMFVGAGLLFAGLTDTCLMGMLLLRLPYNRGATCDLPSVIAELKGERR
jgi:rhodanese-related sulfurtransferase